MIQRDIEKQNLLISIDNYFEIIRDMIIEYGGKVDSNQLTEIIDMSIENNQESQYSAFFVSPLLSKRGDFFFIISSGSISGENGPRSFDSIV